MGFGQVTALHMLQRLFSSYGVVDEIYLEEKAVKIMGTYDLAETLARLINQFKKRRDFSIAVGQMIANAMMMLKVITLLA